jgi:hypothetical protein
VVSRSQAGGQMKIYLPLKAVKQFALVEIALQLPTWF